MLQELNWQVALLLPGLFQLPALRNCWHPSGLRRLRIACVHFFPQEAVQNCLGSAICIIVYRHGSPLNGVNANIWFLSRHPIHPSWD